LEGSIYDHVEEISRNFPRRTEDSHGNISEYIQLVFRQWFEQSASRLRVVTRAVANIIEVQLQTEKAAGFWSINRVVSMEASDEVSILSSACRKRVI
jgi:hypothetical protein